MTKKLDAIVTRAYTDGNNIVAIVEAKDGTRLNPCIIAKGSAKESYLKNELGYSNPEDVHNVPITVTVNNAGSILNAESREDIYNSYGYGNYY